MTIKKQLQEKWLLFQLETKKEPEAFGKLYDLYAEKIYRFIYFKVSSQADAEDLTAEVFLKVWEHIANGKEVRKFAGLLYRTARNKVIDFYRQRKTEKEQHFDETLLGQLSDNGTEAAKREEASELETIIKNLKTLKDEYREALTLRYIDELSVSEIAEIIGKSQIATRVLLHRALKTLKKMTENQNYQSYV
ncbi:MAG: RNA polymerase sigma factor [Candidatus Magasanikbacteria bacterium]|nr:RNA polymerase sigma factor [Candidatus Magasanikbacteria bacterium]